MTDNQEPKQAPLKYRTTCKCCRKKLADNEHSVCDDCFDDYTDFMNKCADDERRHMEGVRGTE